MARLWLEMASRLNLNIFKGFKDEESLVNYALNINNSKRGDTSKVVAGLFYLVIVVSACDGITGWLDLIALLYAK